jgi:dephospho-CoA kinase
VLVIGLTGGIATGKSTVSSIFKNAGAVIIDADRIAREVVKKGRPAHRAIVKNFGKNVLLPDGEINRSVLGEIIFNDPQKKELLNNIHLSFWIYRCCLNPKCTGIYPRWLSSTRPSKSK